MMDASSIGIITSDASRDMACSQREMQYRAGSPQVPTYIRRSTPKTNTLVATVHVGEHYSNRLYKV